MAEDEENSKNNELLHFKVARFMFESAFKLKLSSTTLASACVLYHRFYKECSPQDYDPYTIATTCIFLATKVEEEHTRLRDVVNVCHRTLFPDKPYLGMTQSLWDFKDTVSNCELLVLRTLKFHVTCDHPHRYLLHYLLSLSQLFNERSWKKSPIAQTSWAMLRDLYHGDVCLRHRPQLIAVSCIYLSLLLCKVKVPLNDSAKTEWWKVCHESATQHEIDDVIDDIIDLYDMETECSI